MAAGDTENKPSMNPCCNAWIEKCSKLEKGRNYLRQSVNLLTESFDKIQADNKSLSKELEKKREEAENLIAANVSMEKHLSSMKSEISSLKRNGVNSGNANAEELNRLRSSLLDSEKKIKELSELVKFERERATMEMKKAEAEKKRADQALKQLSTEKALVDGIKKQSVEQYELKMEELRAKLNEAKVNASSLTSELHEAKMHLSEQKSVFDIAKKNEEKLKKLCEESQKNAQNEKSRADNLYVQVEHCLQRIEALKKKVNNPMEANKNSKKRRLMEDSIVTQLEGNNKRMDEMERRLQQHVSSKVEESEKTLQRSYNRLLKGNLKHWKNQYKQAKQLALLEKKQNHTLYKEFVCLKVKLFDIFGHMDLMGKLFSNEPENLPKKNNTKMDRKPCVKNLLVDTQSFSGIDSAKQIFHSSCSSDAEEHLFSFGNYMSLLDLDDPIEEQRYREAIERPLSPSLPELAFSVDIFGGTNDITHFLTSSRFLIADWSLQTQTGTLLTQLLFSLKNASFSSKEKISVLFSILVNNFINASHKKIKSALSDDETKKSLWDMFSLHEFQSSIDELLLQGTVKEYAFGVNDAIKSKSPSKEQLLAGSAVVASLLASTNSPQYARAFCFNVLLSRIRDDSAVGMLRIFAELCPETFLGSGNEAMVLKSVTTFLQSKCPFDSKDCDFSSGSLLVEAAVSKLLECSLSDDTCDVVCLLEVIAVRMGWNWTCDALIPKVVRAVGCPKSDGFVVGILALIGQLGRMGVKNEGYEGGHVAILRRVLCEFLGSSMVKSSFFVQLTAVSSVLEVLSCDCYVACESLVLLRCWFFKLRDDQQLIASDLFKSHANLFCKHD